MREYLRPVLRPDRLHARGRAARVRHRDRHPAADQGRDRRPDRRVVGQPRRLARATGCCIPIGLAAIALGIAEVALNLVRRWVQSTAVAGLEQSMRDDIYQHLQRLEPEFHDAWQSGQLLSRATTDLSAIRRFVGFGIVFMITSLGQLRRHHRAADPAEPAARAAHRRRVRAGDGALPAVRAALRRALPPGSGPAGRPGHLRGGSGGRASACSRRSAAATQAAATHSRLAADRLPDPGRQGAAARRVLGQPGPGAERRDRRDPADRGARGQQRRPDHRRPRRLRRPGAAARLADRGDGLHPGPRPGRRRRPRSGSTRSSTPRRRSPAPRRPAPAATAPAGAAARARPGQRVRQARPRPRRVPLPRRAARRSCGTSASSCPPARRSRWSAGPARARPPCCT